MRLTSRINQLKTSIENGNLDTDELRANWKEIITQAGGTHERVGLMLGIPVVYCDSCGGICFAIKTKTAYNGAQWVCEDKCLSKYTPCEECHTLILIEDVNNPTHVHDGTQAPGRLHFPFELGVAVYNADVMSDGAYFFKTMEEQKLFVRRKLTAKDPEKVFRYLGVELEVERGAGCPPDLLSRTRKVFDKFAMMKHDGSLSRHGKGGWEIVAKPATLAFHKSGIWTPFFQHLGSFFQESPQTTGLHVHIGTATLSPLTVDKIILFINAEENREFVYAMANRNLLKINPNGRLYANIRQWGKADMLRLKQHGAHCPWNPNNKGISNYFKMVNGMIQVDPFGNPIIAALSADPGSVRASCKCAAGHYNIEHYEAVNLRTHRPTVELRIFRGVINEQFLYACLEFADSLADFCSITPLDQLHYKNFIGFLGDKTKRCRNLYRLLVNQCWIDPPKTKHAEVNTPAVYGIYT